MALPMSRRLLGGGALAALLLPLLVHIPVFHPFDINDDVREMGAAGPFEVLAGETPGRPISAVSKGGSIAWTYHYCLTRDLPASEVVELRRIRDGRVMTRRSVVVGAGPDHCVQGAATLQIPADVQSGSYEIVRRIPTRGGAGTILSAIPIEVTP